MKPRRESRSLIFLTVLAAVVGYDRYFLHDAVVSIRKGFVPEELGLLAALVPGGDMLSAYVRQPSFSGLRTRPDVIANAAN